MLTSFYCFRSPWPKRLKMEFCGVCLEPLESWFTASCCTVSCGTKFTILNGPISVIFYHIMLHASKPSSQTASSITASLLVELVASYISHGLYRHLFCLIGNQHPTFYWVVDTTRLMKVYQTFSCGVLTLKAIMPLQENSGHTKLP